MSDLVDLVRSKALDAALSIGVRYGNSAGVIIKDAAKIEAYLRNGAPDRTDGDGETSKSS